MNRLPVKSGNLKSMGYDPINLILEVEFHDGGVYQYYDVPPDMFKGLDLAESKGKYHHQFIKFRYKYKKVE